MTSPQSLIFTVYLADVMVEIENNKFRFEIADDGVLDFFKLNDKKKFEEYHWQPCVRAAFANSLCELIDYVQK